VIAGLAAATHDGRSDAQTESRLLDLLTKRFAPRAVVFTDSGTTALSAALRAVLEGRPGLSVALPAYACYDLATAAEGAGASVLLYDLDPQTLAPDVTQLQATLRHGAAVVVVVD